MMLLNAVFVAVVAGVSEPNPKVARTWHELVGVLQYLEVDYPKAVALNDLEELAEQKMYAAKARNLLNSLGNSGSRYHQAMQSIEASIVAERSPDEVATGCTQLAQRLLREQLGDPSPAQPPDLRRGEALWQEQCASCHGVDGAAQTPAALALTPPPTNLLQGASLTPYRVFNATNFGIEGTAMPSFPFGEDDRWAVAFYVLSLRAQRCDQLPSVEVSLQELAVATDSALAKIVGAEQVSCARTHFSATTTTMPGYAGFQRAQRLYVMGRRDAARSALVDTWSKLEPLVNRADATTRAQLEQAYHRAWRGEQFEASTQALLRQFEQLDARSHWSRWPAIAVGVVFAWVLRRRRVRQLEGNTPPVAGSDLQGG